MFKTYSETEINKQLDEIIFELYNAHDLSECNDQKNTLKKMCLKELEKYPAIQKNLTTKQQIKYFIMQILLESVK